MKITFRKVAFILSALFSFYSMAVHSTVFNIVPKAGTSLPTQVALGSSVKAYYTITNNTGGYHSGNYVKFLPPNVTQITNDPSYPDLCGATFPLPSKGSCTLELNITGAVSAADPNPEHHLFACLGGCTTCCTGTKFSLNVIQGPPLPPQVTGVSPTNGSVNDYATNITITFSEPMNTSTLIPSHVELFDQTASVTATLINPIYSNGNQTVTFGTTAPLTANHTYQIIIPVAANVVAGNGLSLTNGGILSAFSVDPWFNDPCNQAWILNEGNNSLTNCSFDEFGLNTCVGNGENTTGTTLDFPTAMIWNASEGITVANNLGASPLVNVTSQLPDGFSASPPWAATALSNTQTTTPISMAVFNSVGWIANGNGTLTYCTSVNPGLAWNGCTVATPIGYPTNATSITVAEFSTAVVLYTTNTSTNTVSVCTINSSDVITSCQDAGGNDFNQPTNIYVAINSPYALITNQGNNTVLKCAIDPTSQQLSSCTPTGTNFNQPSFIIEYGEFGPPDFAYITNKGNNSVSVCNDANGILTNCNNLAYGFNQPVSISVANICS